MGRITVDNLTATQAIEHLDEIASNNLSCNIIEQYDRLASSLSVSCGESIDDILDGLKEEKKTLQDAAIFLQKMTKYLGDVVGSFEELDTDLSKSFAQNDIKVDGVNKGIFLEQQSIKNANRISDINQSDDDQQVENATKTENNIEYSYSKDNIAVPMQPKYMSKLACLGFAINIINTEGNHFTCNGMDAERIAAELYAHALGYYSSSVLENMGLKSQWISDIKQCGSVADIGLGDGLGPIYQLIWHTP